MSNPVFSSASQTLKSSEVRELLRFAQQPNVISLAGGMPAASLFDVKGIQSACASVLTQTDRQAFQYGATEGQTRLQHEIQQLMRARGVKSSQHRALVTSGSQQGLDLIARAFLNPGDCVVVERPSYLAALQVFNLAQARIIELETDADGAQVDLLNELMAEHGKPKFIYIVSTFSNPSGASLSLSRREKLVRWAAKNSVFILEDDPYGELRFRGSPLPSLLAIAEKLETEIPGASQWIIYASSFSKILMPGLRLGWLQLPQACFDTVARVKQATDLQTASFNQEIAAAYLASGRLKGQLERICQHYRNQQLSLTEALKVHFGDLLRFALPDGGMFIWASFTNPVDTRKLLQFALPHGILFVPGASFYADNPVLNTMRLSFVSVTPEQLFEGVRRLRLAYDEMVKSSI
ncbi:MAG TPA: PLP-dependent aminotransferase family protein [Pseudomonadales bacterium]|nr:PLP-dependent aminotransferase family protein [Pseudomonadales bacterium]